jgi:hypothetical protein
MADSVTFAPQPGQASSSLDVCVPHSLQTIIVTSFLLIFGPPRPLRRPL